MPPLPWSDWALVLASVLFLGVVLIRVRPMLPVAKPKDRKALLELRAKLETAQSDDVRAAILCDAGEVCAKAKSPINAEGYFRRSIRLAPTSVEYVTRAATALAPWPRTLEGFLWRKLSQDDASQAAQMSLQAAGQQLALLYGRSRLYKTRGRALTNLLSASKS